MNDASPVFVSALSYFFYTLILIVHMKCCHFCHFLEQPCDFRMLNLGLALLYPATGDFLSYTALAVWRINMVMKSEL